MADLRPLPFEKPIHELELQLQKLAADPNPSANIKDAVRKIRLELTRLKREIYAQLSPWEIVQDLPYGARGVAQEALEDASRGGA